jgi:carboxymethylenebutenolidase
VVADLQLAYSEDIWNVVSPALVCCPKIVAGVVYVDGQKSNACGTDILPLLKHVAGPPNQIGTEPAKSLSKRYHYPKSQGQWFSAGGIDFDYSADSVAHTRNLQFLKPKMGGPYFDLEDIWEEHTYYEFADRSVEHTMSTMVQEPYVNHVPTVSANPLRYTRH